MGKKRKIFHKKAQQKKFISSQGNYVIKFFIGFFSLFLIIISIPVISLVQNIPVKSVLGTVVFAYRKGIITWKPVANAAGYNIYYKQQSDKQYLHAVRSLPASSTSYTITFLKKNTNYQYIITAFDPSSKEFWFSGQKWIWNFK